MFFKDVEVIKTKKMHISYFNPFCHKYPLGCWHTYYCKQQQQQHWRCNTVCSEDNLENLDNININLDYYLQEQACNI